MRALITNLAFKILKIITLIIFVYPTSIAFGAISTFVDDIDVPANDKNGQNIPHGVTFNSDGTKMYIIGSSANRIIQYTLSTPFDISEATLLAGSICTEGFAGDGLKIIFNSDGAKFFLVDDATQDVEILTLTTAYDISTCSNTGSKDFGTTNLRDLKFSNDGKKVFLYDQGGTHSLKQYSLSSAFDISNPTLVTTYTGTSSKTLKQLTGNSNKVNGLAFSSVGTKMFVTNDTKITEFTLSNPFDLSNVTSEGREDISDQITNNKISGIAFNNDGSKVLFTDEWGGGGRPRCRAWDPLNWGADAIYDIKDQKLVFQSHYKMPAPQLETENCVAHNGSIIPIPNRDIFVQAWYQGGISVMDFTDSSNPVEIGYFDRGPISENELITGGYWSAYYYEGYIYATEITRGLDVFKLLPSQFLSEDEIDAASKALPVQGPQRLFNPQQQIPLVSEN